MNEEFENKFQYQVGKLQSAAKALPLHSHMELLFRVLCGLPTQITISLAVERLSRYLPVFQNYWPQYKWPSIILNDPFDWVCKNGCSIGEVPDSNRSSDNAYFYAFDALVNGIFYANDYGCVTSSCSIAVTQARVACSANVWEADDPAAVELWRNGEFLPGRGLEENVASLAIAEREWTSLISSLRSEEIRLQFKLPKELEICTYLDRWRGSGAEFCLKEPFSGPKDE